MIALQENDGNRWCQRMSTRHQCGVHRQRQNALASTIEIGGASLHLDIVLAATEAAFDLTISAPAETPLHVDVRYPFAFRAPSGQYRLALPHQAGLLLRVEDAASRQKFTKPLGCYGGGLSMPWIGVTDLGGGLLFVIETPEGAGVTPQLAGSAFAPQVFWQPSRDTLGYARKLHYRLFDAGGYVAMCKYYRNRLVQEGRFVTLREKEKSRPQLQKLIGALDLHMKGNDQDQREMIQQLESRGVKHLLINTGAGRETLDWMRQAAFSSACTESTPTFVPAITVILTMPTPRRMEVPSTALLIREETNRRTAVRCSRCRA